MERIPLLQFEPIFREYVWGGRRLGSELGKPIGAGEHYAESWEIVDHGADQSIVRDGPLAGASLHELVTQHGEALLGRHHPRPRFPLLFKYLDAQQTLSVQVHPDDAKAAKLDPPDLGKTEAWVVLAAEAGSKIYAGLRAGIDRAELERAVQRGRCEASLHQFEAKAGDCVFIPARTVHALGAGLLIAEIQQASDTTFRLYDWDRVDSDGLPRALHVEQSLDTIDFAHGPVGPQTPQPADQPHIERLVACEKFVLDRWRIDGPVTLRPDNRFHIVAVTEGNVTLAGGGSSLALRRGATILVPACCERVAIAPQGRAELLDIYLP